MSEKIRYYYEQDIKQTFKEFKSEQDVEKCLLPNKMT